MKNWDKKPDKPESLFKKKGFYVALYSCLGVVMISAAALSFTSLLKNDSPSPINTQTERNYNDPNLGEMLPADNSYTQSIQNYLTPEDRDDIAKALPTGNTDVNGTPRPTSPPPENPEATPGSDSSSAVDENLPEAEIETAEAPIQAETVVEKSEPAVDNQNTVSIEPSIKEGPGFTPYSAEAQMKWPLVGELVMDFSTDHLIYDATLNQFRTNDNLCISAAIGTQVKTTAAGVVKEIGKSREKGNTVTIDHGNGWTTVYSELQDGILVTEGEVVKEGQVIGGVGSPSIYNILMGSHLQFAVAKDGAAIDPKTVLAN